MQILPRSASLFLFLPRLFFLGLIFFHFYPVLFAQGSPRFIGSSIGTLSTSIYILSQPLIINFSDGCLQVDSGIPTWKTVVSPNKYTYPCNENRLPLKIDLGIYPNPTQRFITIKSNRFENLSQAVQVFVYSAIGQLLLVKLIRLLDIQRGYMLDLQFLPPGIYTVIVRGQLVEGVGRIIKIKD